MTLIFFYDLRILWFDLRLLVKISRPQRFNSRSILRVSSYNSGSIYNFRFMLERNILMIDHRVLISALTSIIYITEVAFPVFKPKCPGWIWDRDFWLHWVFHLYESLQWGLLLLGVHLVLYFALDFSFRFLEICA